MDRMDDPMFVALPSPEVLREAFKLELIEHFGDADFSDLAIEDWADEIAEAIIRVLQYQMGVEGAEEEINE